MILQGDTPTKSVSKSAYSIGSSACKYVRKACLKEMMLLINLILSGILFQLMPPLYRSVCLIDVNLCVCSV